MVVTEAMPIIFFVKDLESTNAKKERVIFSTVRSAEEVLIGEMNGWYCKGII